MKIISSNVAAVAAERAVLAGLKAAGEPVTLAVALGRAPGMREVAAAARLHQGGFILRTNDGRYSVNPNPPAMVRGPRSQRGHGVAVRSRPISGQVSGKKLIG